MRGMHDLGVELHPCHASGGVLERGDRCARGRREHLETVGCTFHAVAVGHPHVQRIRKATEQDTRLADVQGSPAVFAPPGSSDRAPETLGHDLESVADAEHRKPELQDLGIEIGGAGRVDARRSPAQDDGRRGPLGYFGCRDGVRDDLGVHARLAHPAGDELGVLGAEVDDQHGLPTSVAFLHAREPSHCR